ncbi:hypothetical protein KY290_014181 [Solanum tuberosum]|uniref:Uncharacterized protein n=1 Tax=Solanum tuberosum TaxID=4113 RepID=A0ABQ7VNW8_SOLTU|nr:hypothetical protein KY284_013574 [Solanum tuberosum]KAH0719598.1 hypothetical protein KY285_015629 [Solanum tuberosum]KAH0770200.1 hypothetical protein KY290_014181 [Solanum tuberosum]
MPKQSQATSHFNLNVCYLHLLKLNLPVCSNVAVNQWNSVYGNKGSTDQHAEMEVIKFEGSPQINLIPIEVDDNILNYYKSTF